MTLPKGVKETTLRKLLVGLFHSYASGASFAVINLHCKCFKEYTQVQAAFLAAAQRLIATELADDAPRATPERKLPVFIVGDMNIDSKVCVWVCGCVCLCVRAPGSPPPRPSSLPRSFASPLV